MTRTAAVALGAAIAGCTPIHSDDDDLGYAELEPAPENAPTVSSTPLCGADTPTHEGPPHDALVLRLARTGPPEIAPGDHVGVEARVFNTGDGPHGVVLPGDGSESGWREPHVWFSGFRKDAEGCWQPVPRKQLLRCGNYDAAWWFDIETLDAGANRKLEWLGMPSSTLDLAEPGTVRVYLHYEFRDGKFDKRQFPTARPHHGIDVFGLVSNPIEFEVAR